MRNRLYFAFALSLAILTYSGSSATTKWNNAGFCYRYDLSNRNFQAPPPPKFTLIYSCISVRLGTLLGSADGATVLTKRGDEVGVLRRGTGETAAAGHNSSLDVFRSGMASNGRLLTIPVNEFSPGIDCGAFSIDKAWQVTGLDVVCGKPSTACVFDPIETDSSSGILGDLESSVSLAGFEIGTILNVGIKEDDFGNGTPGGTHVSNAEAANSVYDSSSRLRGVLWV